MSSPQELSSRSINNVEPSQPTQSIGDEDVQPIQSTGDEDLESDDEATIDETEVFKKPKRRKKSVVWDNFKELIVGSEKMVKCTHCKVEFKQTSTSTTTSMLRHMKTCSIRLRNLKEPRQQKLNFQSGDSGTLQTYLHSGKFDMAAMRESTAEWVLMHEHPFSIVEEEGFNLMLKRGMPEWQRISRTGNKNDCKAVFEREKNKLKASLTKVKKISLTTDLWKSKNQKIEYMVITGHWIDNYWNLQKRVLNFVHIPPPRRGVQIADSIYKCVKEWGIESKVYTISVDNASNNDTALRALKDTFSRNKCLLAKGNLFHVRCCAHILNLMVQDGLSQIKDIIGMIRGSVDFINKIDGRRLLFAEIVQQLQLPGKQLIYDCKTRWNSTYEMLACALKFREVFPRFQDREPNYDLCPSVEDWEKVKKLCNILQVFWTATHVMSGSDYPTSKYWGECNLLMSIAAILDPRCKMKVINYCFPLIYPPHEVELNISKVSRALYDLYAEYEEMYASKSSGSNLVNSDTSTVNTSDSTSLSISQFTGMSEFLTHISTTERVQPQKNELDSYFEDGLLTSAEDSNVDIVSLDALKWWRDTTKYKILPKMAADILAIPVSTVASEATFSAGTRIIDSYRSSLAPETVEMLVCGSDWCRKLHGVKKATKKVKQAQEILLPIS